MYRKRHVIVILLLLACFFLFAGLAHAEPGQGDTTNLIYNPSFEITDSTALPEGWFCQQYDKSLETTVFTIGDFSHSGDFCAVIENKRMNDARYLQAVKVGENSIYRLSCWIWAEDVSAQGKGANLSIGNRLETSKQIRDTGGEWQYVEIYARIGQGVDSINVTAGVGGYSGESTGKAAFDDITAAEVSEIPEGAVVADISKPVEGNDSNDSNEGNEGNTGNEGNAGGISSLLLYLILISATLAWVAFLLIRKTMPVKTCSDDEKAAVAGFFENDLENGK